MVLKVSDLSVGLKEKNTVLLKSLSFELDFGKSMILLGESGSGKTITCHAILGLLSSAFCLKGSIIFENSGQYDLLKLEKRQLQSIYGISIAFIPQNPMTALNPSLRVGIQMLETLRIHRRMKKQQASFICRKALSEAGLDNPEHIMKSYLHTLSGGMLQRVLIAMVLMMKAKLVITDEPTSALDVIHRNAVLDEFSKLKKGGTALLMVTHDFYAARSLGGDLIILKEGEVVERGSVKEILEAPKHNYTKELIWAASYDRKKKDA